MEVHVKWPSFEDVEARVRDVIPSAQRVMTEKFDFGSKMGIAVELAGGLRKAARIQDASPESIDQAIELLREWVDGINGR